MQSHMLKGREVYMIYGYARCSTNEKLQDINRQVRELKSNISIMEDKIPDAVTGEYALTIDELKQQIDRQHQKEKEQKQIV